MKKILIVEDEEHIATGLRFNLEEEGFECDIVADGEEALQVLIDESRSYDAVVLDIMLPGISGFDVAKKLRSERNFVPILMLTARGHPEDVLKGFEAGTDDYLPKPFDLAIFLARLNGLLRRTEWQGERPEHGEIASVFEINGRKIDLANLEITSEGESTQLTLMEAKLLKHLVDNAGRAVSRKEILEEVWGLHEDTDTRAIDNFIVRLRRHLENDPGKPEVLQTVRGVGYRFNADR
jgi:DNA-binding response OmpR family regulator